MHDFMIFMLGVIVGEATFFIFIAKLFWTAGEG